MAAARAHGFLAVGMARQPLPREHGSPARLLVSCRHGQDGNLTWLRRLAVTATPPPSHRGSRGSADGTHPVHPASRIDVPGARGHLAPGEVPVRGGARAPPVGVDRVQLQVDGGPWTDATLGPDLGPDAWRPWSATWQAAPGRRELRVRRRTTTGEWQEETTSTTPVPHGSAASTPFRSTSAAVPSARRSAAGRGGPHPCPVGGARCRRVTRLVRPCHILVRFRSIRPWPSSPRAARRRCRCCSTCGSSTT
ncbi:molybdopterin-dependent oxidoreductase [Geodermatophilus normandii]|uniref:molybdopterin-dependent oxidoreductase n=1 Tax=Geodermatophilus normandii TaxID=1137989 RepID=UPI000D70ACDB